jgi:pentatricopeptide repeat protein
VNQAIKRAADRADAAGAAHIFETEVQERGIRPDEITFRHFLTALGRAGWATRAKRVFNDMKKYGFKANEQAVASLAAAATVAGSADALRYAMEQAERLESEGSPPSRVLLNSLVAGAAACGQPQLADSVFARFGKQDLTADVVSFTALMQSRIAAGQVREAFALLDSMRAAGVRPDAGTYTVLVGAAARLSRADLALDLVDDMRRLGIAVPPAVAGLAATAVARASDAAAMWPRCEPLLAIVRAGGGHPDAPLYAALMRAAVAAGRAEVVEQVLLPALRKDRVPSSGEVTNVLVGLRGRANDPEVRSKRCRFCVGG